MGSLMAVKSTAVTVGTTAVRIDTVVETDRPPGSSIIPYNGGSVTVYIGGSDVTTVNGGPIPAATWGPPVDVCDDEGVYLISGTAGQNVRVLEVGV